MSAPITLHVEAGDSHFSAYLECAGKTQVLTEEEFQHLTDRLAYIALPLKPILQSFMTAHCAHNTAEART
ncbi:MAG: hypothetical protein WCD42_14740 [Rhizomicrobium sp.]